MPGPKITLLLQVRPRHPIRPGCDCGVGAGRQHGGHSGGHRQGHLGLCYPRVTNTYQRHFGESPAELELLNTTSAEVQQYLQNIIIHCPFRNISLSTEKPFSLPCPSYNFTQLYVFKCKFAHKTLSYKKSLFAAFSEKCNSFQLFLSLTHKDFSLELQKSIH